MNRKRINTVSQTPLLIVFRFAGVKRRNAAPYYVRNHGTGNAIYTMDERIVDARTGAANMPTGEFVRGNEKEQKNVHK